MVGAPGAGLTMMVVFSAVVHGPFVCVYVLVWGPAIGWELFLVKPVSLPVPPLGCVFYPPYPAGKRARADLGGRRIIRTKKQKPIKGGRGNI